MSNPDVIIPEDIAEYLVSTGQTFDEVLDRALTQAEAVISGDGFVMKSETSTLPRQVWPDIEGDVRELEKLLK